MNKYSIESIQIIFVHKIVVKHNLSLSLGQSDGFNGSPCLCETYGNEPKLKETHLSYKE